MRIETITTILDLAGVFANAVLGGAAARSRRLDLFGYAVLGLVSGLGGGVIRDILLQQARPPPLSILTTSSPRWPGPLWLSSSMSRDAAGAGSSSCWTPPLSACGPLPEQKSLGAGLGWLPVILLGTLTAVGGGATRDLMLQRVPDMFGGNSLYASVAVLVAGNQVRWTRFGKPVAEIVIGVLSGLLLRLVAYRQGWRLPTGLNYQSRRGSRRGRPAATP